MIIQPDGRERHGGFYHFIVEFGDVVDGGGSKFFSIIGEILSCPKAFEFLHFFMASAVCWG